MKCLTEEFRRDIRWLWIISITRKSEGQKIPEKGIASKYVKARTEYLTPHTVREIHKTLRNAFNQAVKWELMWETLWSTLRCRRKNTRPETSGQQKCSEGSGGLWRWYSSSGYQPYNTLQVSDYSKFNMSSFDEEVKKKTHDELFPMDLQNAYNLGSQLSR